MRIKGCKQAIIVIIMLLCFLSVMAGCGGGAKSPSPVLKKIQIQPATITVQKNGTCEFTAVGKDQNGKTMTIKPTWSITGKIGTVAPSTGTTTTFTATVVGSGTIVAKVGNVTGTAEVTVTEVEAVLTTIEISPSSVTMVKEDTQEFSVTGKDQYGAEIDLPAAAVWTVEGNIGVLSTNQGQTVAFTATTVGDGAIKVSVGSLTEEAQVKVLEAGDQPVLLRIEVSPGYSEFGKGETKTFTATGYDQYDNELTINPTWSVTGVSGTFSPETGSTTVFTSTSAGEGMITATVGAIFGAVEISVSEAEAPRLARIEILREASIILEGETISYYARGYDQHDNEFSSFTPIWSVTGGIGTVYPSSGKNTNFTGTSGWDGTVVATVGEISASAELTVIPKIIRVGVDKDFQTIQEAIDVALDGVTIVVDEGEYYEGVTIEHKNITLKSTNPDSEPVVAGTIINGGEAGSTVLISGASYHTVTVEGFTITGGVGGDLISSNHYGGGVYAYGATTILRRNVISGNSAHNGGGGIYARYGNLTLEENTIEGNSSYFEGGGIYLTGEFSAPLLVTLENNIIRENTSEDRSGGGIYSLYAEGSWSGNSVEENSAKNCGGLYLHNSSISLLDNQIINNTAEAGCGGICLNGGDGGSVTISNNLISGNVNNGTGAYGYGGGVKIGSSVELVGNTISNNQAYGGGGIFASANVTLTDNVISGNTADFGGGVFAQDNITLISNAIDGNEVAYDGGGIYVYDGKELTASGNEFTHNQGYAIFLAPSATWTDEGDNTFSNNEPGDVYSEE